MSSNTQKGNQHELEVKKHLEAEGWFVFRQHRKPAFMRDKKTQKFRMITIGADIFGCDLVCKKAGEKTRWIQVGADGAKSKKEDQLNEYPWDTTRESVEIWLRVEGKKAYKVYVLESVELSGGGFGQSFVEKGLCSVGHSATTASARLLSGGASSVR